MFDVARNINEIVYFNSSVHMNKCLFWQENVMDACVQNEKQNKRKYYMTKEYQHAVLCVSYMKNIARNL